MTNKELEVRIRDLEDAFKFQGKQIDRLIDDVADLKNEQTAKQQQHHEFKVGDRVQFEEYNGEIVVGTIRDICMDKATIEQKTEDGVGVYIMGEVHLGRLKPATDEQKQHGKKALLSKLEKAWNEHPDLRFCQLISSITKNEDCFYTTDSDFEKMIDNYGKEEVDEPKCKFKVGDLAQTANGDTVIILKIYKSKDGVTLCDVKDGYGHVFQLPLTGPKCKFKVGDKARIKNKKDINFGSIVTILDVPKGQEKHYEVKFESQMLDWLLEKDLEPYTETRWTFTDDEKVILRAVSENYNYLVRSNDANDTLWLFENEPTKNIIFWSDKTGKECVFEFYNHLFQSIKWSDEQPCEFRKFI